MNKTPTAPLVLDYAHLERTTGGAPELMRDMLQMLADEMPLQATRLRQAEENGDLAWLRETAHQLQGTAAYTGACRLGDAAARVEALIRKGNATALPNALRRLHASIEDLEQVCRERVR